MKSEIENSHTDRGRGAATNPVNRFESLSLALEPEGEEEEKSSRATVYFKDQSQTILSRNESPDVGFSVSLNPYRGCEHGCVYCYARPTHEYLGFSSGLDFESKIMVKTKAPELLRKELSKPRWEPQVIAMSGVTDCYQPVERRLAITRGCLQVFAEFRNPVTIVTKNYLITRDLDYLQELARFKAVAAYISVTTLNEDLRRKMEPRTSTSRRRLEAIEELAKAGIPVGVLVAPVIPGLNDSEIPAILKAAAEAGAQGAGYVMLRLPFALKTLFEEWLLRHFPERREKILHRIESVRGGQLNDSRFVSRMRGEGIFAQQVQDLFRISVRKAGLEGGLPQLSIAAFQRPGREQISLFVL